MDAKEFEEEYDVDEEVSWEIIVHEICRQSCVAIVARIFFTAIDGNGLIVAIAVAKRKKKI